MNLLVRGVHWEQCHEAAKLAIGIAGTERIAHVPELLGTRVAGCSVRTFVVGKLRPFVVPHASVWPQEDVLGRAPWISAFLCIA